MRMLHSEVLGNHDELYREQSGLKGSLLIASLYFTLTFLLVILEVSEPLGTKAGILYLLLGSTSSLSPWKKDTLILAMVCTVLNILGFFALPWATQSWAIVESRVMVILGVWVVAILVYKAKQTKSAPPRPPREDRMQVEFTRDAFALFNHEGRLIDCNETACDLFKGNQENLLGFTVSELFDSDSSKNVEGCIDRLLKTNMKEIAPFKSTLTTKNGRIIPTEIRATLIDQADRKQVALQIHEFKERRASATQFPHSDEHQDYARIASAVAHEFKNILTIIIGRAELSEAAATDEKLAKNVRVIKETALRGAKTAARLEGFSQTPENQVETVINLNKVASDAIAYLRSSWQKEEERIGFDIEIVEDLRAKFDSVKTEESEFQDALVQLISNAVDAMPEGGQVRCSTVNRNKSVVLSLMDTGAGMSQEVLKRALDPFYTTKGEESLGLGLTSAHAVVKKCGGEMEIESEPYRGTTVRITLPIASEDVSQPEDEKPFGDHEPENNTEVKDYPKGGTESASGSGPQRSLIIDDEQELVEALADILEEVGHEVVGCTDPEEGVRAFQQQDFDIVFVDLAMPGMHGSDVVREVRKVKEDIPIIVLTALGKELSRVIFAKSRIDALVSKPFTRVEILRSIEECFANRKNVLSLAGD